MKLFVKWAALAAVLASSLTAQSVVLSVPAIDQAGNPVLIGKFYATWQPFVSNSGVTIPGGATSSNITNGTIHTTLTASDSAGYIYNILIMNGATANTFQWKVPATGATTMAALNKPAPSQSTGASGAAGGDLSGTYPNPTLAAVNSNVGSFGDATHTVRVTLNGKGLVTAASTNALPTFPSGAIVGTTDTQTLTNKSIAASEINSGTLSDARMPAGVCTLTKYTVAYNDAALHVSSASPTKTLVTLPSANTRICLVEISGTNGFTGIANLTAATVRLQSGAATPLLYSPNQDVFGTVGASTNNFWTDSGNSADRTNRAVVAAFTFSCSSGSCFGSGLTAGSVDITIGVRTMP